MEAAQIEHLWGLAKQCDALDPAFPAPQEHNLYTSSSLGVKTVHHASHELDFGLQAGNALT